LHELTGRLTSQAADAARDERPTTNVLTPSYQAVACGLVSAKIYDETSGGMNDCERGPSAANTRIVSEVVRVFVVLIRGRQLLTGSPAVQLRGGQKERIYVGNPIFTFKAADRSMSTLLSEIPGRRLPAAS